MKKKKQFSIYIKVILVYVIFAILAPVLANDKPVYLSVEGHSYFPALSNNAYIKLNGENHLLNSVDWRNLIADVKIFAPFRYSPGKSDLINSYKSPFEKQYFILNGELKELSFFERHFLGTGKLGNDTLAELIHGTRISVLVGLLSVAIALLFGLLLGGLAGFFGDYGIRVSRIQIFIAILLLIPAWFYAFYLRKELLSISFQTTYFSGIAQLIVSLILFLGIILLPFFLKINFRDGKKINLPLDSIISRVVEIFVAIPGLILILTIAALTKPSIATVIIMIGITSWTEIARIVRSQILQMKKLNYIDAAQSTGMTTFRLFAKHILPNLKDQVLSIAIFGVAAAILIETGLSFLGIGVPSGTPTWGQVMFEARQHYTAWWLVLFSGMAISGLLYSLYLFSQKQLMKTKAN